MKKNMYLVNYCTKGKIYEEPLTTFQTIVFLILSVFNKKVGVYSIKYNSFLSEGIN